MEAWSFACDNDVNEPEREEQNLYVTRHMLPSITKYIQLWCYVSDSACGLYSVCNIQMISIQMTEDGAGGNQVFEILCWY